MKTIAVMNQKGGAGKSTLSVHIATAAQIAGHAAAVLDMDQQASAESWAGRRLSETGKEEPAVIAAKAATLGKWLDQVKAHGAKLSVLDTPPVAQNEAVEAAKAADLILIPCRPSGFDLHAMRLTASLAQTMKKPAYVVFNAGPTNKTSGIYDQAAGFIGELGIKQAPVRICERIAFKQAVLSGQTAQEIEPKGKAAGEINALWLWLAQTLKLK